MSLSPKPSRPLTSREIAGILSAQLGGFAGFCDADAIADALQHFHENRATYVRYWRAMKDGGSRAVAEQFIRDAGVTPVFVPDDDPDHRGSVYDDEGES